MERKTIVTTEQKIDGRQVTGIAAVFGNIDSYQDIIHLGAFRKTIKERFSRFRHLWQHDMVSPPTAKVISVKELKRADLPESMLDNPYITGGLEVVREYLRTTRGDEILEGLAAGAISEMSFAYDAIKYDFEEIERNGQKRNVRNLREVRLWETSDVLWGANDRTVAAKGVLQYCPTGTLPKDAIWRKPVLADFTELSWHELPSGEKERIKAHFAYIAGEDSFSSLMLPHHQPSKRGIGKVVLEGIREQILKLYSIPARHKHDAFQHLAKHCEEWGVSLPSWDMVELLSVFDPNGLAMLELSQNDMNVLFKVRDLIVSQIQGVESISSLTTTMERNLLQQRIELAKLSLE